MRLSPLTNKVLCDWGHEVGTDDDNNLCTEHAVGIVAVKDGAGFHKLSLCAGHRLLLVGETSPL